jgi:hypothetical protein
MKALLTLLIAWYIQGETLTAMDTWIRMVGKVDLVSVVFPALDMNLDFHDGSRSVMASTRGCSSDLLSW